MHQIHTCRHHRRGMDEGADWRRAFHRVGQPDVERELGALAHRPRKNQQPDDRRRRQAKDRRTGLDQLLQQCRSSMISRKLSVPV